MNYQLRVSHKFLEVTEELFAEMYHVFGLWFTDLNINKIKELESENHELKKKLEALKNEMALDDTQLIRIVNKHSGLNRDKESKRALSIMRATKDFNL